MGKTTGIVRKIDHLGRIVIPKEMCRTLNITSGDPLEISLEGKRIVVAKHEVGCIFCDAHDALTDYNGKLICRSCLKHLRTL